MRLADVHVVERERYVVARLSGELDLSNATGVGEAVVSAVPNSAHALILDLHEVAYLDSAGIHLIYKLREKLRARGQELRLVVPDTSPAGDALRMAGVLHHITTVDTVDAAVAAGE